MTFNVDLDIFVIINYTVEKFWTTNDVYIHKHSYDDLLTYSWLCFVSISLFNLFLTELYFLYAYHNRLNYQFLCCSEVGQLITYTSFILWYLGGLSRITPGLENIKTTTKKKKKKGFSGKCCVAFSSAAHDFTRKSSLLIMITVLELITILVT